MHIGSPGKILLYDPLCTQKLCGKKINFQPKLILKCKMRFILRSVNRKHRRSFQASGDHDELMRSENFYSCAFRELMAMHEEPLC